ncbi:hypothetical protein EJ03DRAFT_373478 [Teratosphaeria nubilosa]|uniref:BTB domain-containing protein n=1 Tax=Teratosphaeria nubilosa TaxID=161662 RepID=A0A6G1LDT9_9PEZI|nr:hypothetical protein EJ03DRAFT_373478 [Teratosphaeria nubilosa]
MEAMKQGLIKLFNEKKLTDFTIICGPYTFEVHKAVVCAQSEYFAALPNFSEGTTNKISLKSISDDEDSDDSCDDPEAIKLMIHYFYHHDYRAKNVFDAPSAASVLAKPPRHIASSAPSPHKRVKARGISAARLGPMLADTTDDNMVMHARVFAAACKYHVRTLQTAAAIKFLAAVTANWDHHSFAEAARTVFSSTPEDVMTLRTVIVNAIDDHPDVLTKKEFRNVVKVEQDLMYSIICKNYGVQDPDAKTAGKQGAGPELGCADCGARLRQLRPCSNCGKEYASCCTALCSRNCRVIIHGHEDF